LSKWFRKMNRIAEVIKAKEVAKQEKYLKIAKRFLDEATLNDSKESIEENDETKGKSSPRGRLF
jgi:hypothetical protein